MKSVWSRPASATNPESGTVSYAYDNNGNLTSKTDPRTTSGLNWTTTIACDALNRPTSKTYSNDGGVTPPVYYFYDSQTLPTGAPSFTRGYSAGRLVSTDPIALTSDRLSDPQRINLYSYARNNPLKYVDPDGEDTVEQEKTQYSFEIEKKGNDSKGRPWNIQVKVTVTETRTVRRDSNGNVTQRSPIVGIEATAVSTGNVTVSKDDLNTIGRVTETIIKTSEREGVAKEDMLAIGYRETMLGSDSSGDNPNVPHTSAAINPMKITLSSRTTIPSPDNMPANVLMSILHYEHVSAGASTQAEGFDTYPLPRSNQPRSIQTAPATPHQIISALRAL